MLGTFAEIAKENEHRPQFSRWLREQYNHADLSPQKAARTIPGEGSSLNRSQALIALLWAIGEKSFKQKELAQELGIKYDQLRRWLEDDNGGIGAKAQELTNEYPNLLLDKLTAIMATIKDSGSKEDVSEEDAQQFEEVFIEACWLSGGMLEFFCQKLGRYVDEGSSSEMISLAEAYVLKAIPATISDYGPTHTLSRKLMVMAFTRDFSNTRAAIEAGDKDKALEILTKFSDWVLKGISGQVEQKV